MKYDFKLTGRRKKKAIVVLGATDAQTETVWLDSSGRLG